MPSVVQIIVKKENDNQSYNGGQLKFLYTFQMKKRLRESNKIPPSKVKQP
jgi:hypothetical protein